MDWASERWRAAARQQKLLKSVKVGDVGTVRELLATQKFKLNDRDEFGSTTLHLATRFGTAAIVDLLLNAGASVQAADVDGSTPLHEACKWGQPDVVRLLLEANANLDAKDKNGLAALHLLMTRRHQLHKLETPTLRSLQVLVTFGATWDTHCDEIVVAGKSWNEVPTLKLCMSLWAEEHADGRPPSDVPIENIRRGVESTQTYFDGLKRSSHIVHRRKICLVGPSCSGKTSFVKSITANRSLLEDEDDRTIGIDHFPLQFKQQGSGKDKPKIHEVTFWDFAGQDAYQVAHSFFFSPRTLYFVFVDLEAFAIAYRQAVIFAHDGIQEPKLLDEFFECEVLQWVRLIVARQSEAEFVFIATKEDLLQENDSMKHIMKQELALKLQGVLVNAHTMKNPTRKEITPSAHDLQGKVDPMIVYFSSASDASVQAGRVTIETIIVRSDRSYPMPDDYSNVLEAIRKTTKDARNGGVTAWINHTFVPVNELLTSLNHLEIEGNQCRNILQTLHDLGDVLWYEQLKFRRFRKTIILDPMLLIEFVRQIITHEHTHIKMSHADLEGKPFWRNLGDDRELMKAMKQLMQSFHLVYSDAEDRVMEWDSHLIVPAYWKTREPATWRFLGGGWLTTTNGSSEGEVSLRARVRWDYHFTCGLPSTVFDHFVVSCVSPFFHFDAGPDWLLHEDADGLTACRVMIGRDRRSLHRTIHVEAVVTTSASETQELALWGHFKRFVRALVLILYEHNGLIVSCNARDVAGREHELKGLLRLTDPPEQPTWMPPFKMWASLQLRSDSSLESTRCSK